MRRIRLIFAWLLLAALPLQGFAAMSMLFCQQRAMPLLEQAAHGHAEHAFDGHASHHDATATPDETTDADAAGGHGCPICAAGCNVVGIPEAAPVLALAPAVHFAPAEPAVVILARSPPLPDKPPRA